MGGRKPIIVLVHGAWQRQEHLSRLRETLVQRDFMVLQPENASAGNDVNSVRGKTHLDDVSIIHKTISPALDAGEEMIIVCHSYGGIPASAALESFQIGERRAHGLPGGIIHIVYLAAVALPAKGMSLLAALGGQWPEFMDVKNDIVALGDKAKDALLNDQAPDEASRLLEKSVYQSRASLETEASFVAADVRVPKTYVACEDDHAIPLEAQLGMAAAIGDNTTVVRVRSGHMVYYNEVALKEIADTIGRIVEL